MEGAAGGAGCQNALLESDWPKVNQTSRTFKNKKQSCTIHMNKNIITIDDSLQRTLHAILKREKKKLEIEKWTVTEAGCQYDQERMTEWKWGGWIDLPQNSTRKAVSGRDCTDFIILKPLPHLLCGTEVQSQCKHRFYCLSELQSKTWKDRCPKKTHSVENIPCLLHDSKGCKRNKRKQGTQMWMAWPQGHRNVHKEHGSPQGLSPGETVECTLIVCLLISV